MSWCPVLVPSLPSPAPFFSPAPSPSLPQASNPRILPEPVPASPPQLPVPIRFSNQSQFLSSRAPLQSQSHQVPCPQSNPFPQPYQTFAPCHSVRSYFIKSKTNRKASIISLLFQWKKVLRKRARGRVG